MKKAFLTAACTLFFSAGLAQAQVSVRIGPPPSRREFVPARPYAHPDWVWQRGYNRWDGQRYVWAPGAYVAPPRAHARWISGEWVHRRGAWVWREGYWR